MNNLLNEAGLVAGFPAKAENPAASDVATSRRLPGVEPRARILDANADPQQPIRPETLVETAEPVLRAANGSAARRDAMISFLARIPIPQPYPHGGINE